MKRLNAAHRTSWTASLALGLCTATATLSLESSAQPVPPPVTYQHVGTDGPALVALARKVGGLSIGEPSLVVVGPVAATPREEGPNEKALEVLRSKVRAAVAPAVELAKIQEKGALDEKRARQKARALDMPLVYLAPKLSAGDLLLDVTVKKWPTSFWQRARFPEGTLVDALHVRVAVDSSIRSLFPKDPPTLDRAIAVPSPLRTPLSIVCGDIDRDGRDDIALVDRQEIVLGHIQGELFKSSARIHWSTLSEVAGTPLRAPLARAVIEDGQLVVGSSDRHRLLFLDEQLTARGFAERSYPLDEHRCSSFTATGISPLAATCPAPQAENPTATPPSTSESETGLDAYVMGTFSSAEGVSQRAQLKLPHASKTAVFSMSSAVQQKRTVELPDVGQAAALSDLDGDGTIEVVNSSPGGEASGDVLTVRTFESGRFRKVAEREMAPIAALDVCPFSGKNPLSIIVVAGGQLWLIE